MMDDGTEENGGNWIGEMHVKLQHPTFRSEKAIDKGGAREHMTQFHFRHHPPISARHKILDSKIFSGKQQHSP